METVKGQITILADNTVPERSDALGEHGFSAFLGTEKGRFLFDTGKGKTVVHNALICKMVNGPMAGSLSSKNILKEWEPVLFSTKHTGKLKRASS